MTRRILVTNALPYVNGPIHLGHLVGYIQGDIWVRFQRMRGHDVGYFCGDDTHGTATMIRAQEEGREPEAILEQMSTAHQEDFAAFSVEFDHYGSTHSPGNQALVANLWKALRENDCVQGACPRCKAPEQSGDNCDVCGGVYTPDELGDPKSTITGTTPEVRSAPHFFVTLEKFHAFLEEWVAGEGRLQPEVANQLKGSFLSEPLRDWDVSRPAPYFGFEIPDAPGHYFYVWLDAPVGYIASTQEWCEANGQSLDDWWRNPEREIHHFIGKDIVYFHALFWPAMLKTAGFQLPTRIQVNGFLTVNGEKMSKRKGTFIMAETYRAHLSPDYLRYYFASKFGASVTDLDLNLEEFVAKVNSDLVGKVVNLASRTARFMKGQNLCEAYPDDGGLFENAARTAAEIADAYEVSDTGRATRLIMALADRANEYVEEKAPWALKKQEGKEELVREVCSVSLNLFRQITTLLQPVLPALSLKANALLGIEGPSVWDDARTPLTGNPVAKFEHLMRRVDPDRVQAVVDASAEPAG
jgi:methionyl-tRNA synthetase